MLTLAARHGRHLLIAGLIAGVGLPDLAAALRPWVPHMLAGLLFLNAFRSGPRLAAMELRTLRRAVTLVLVLQLGLPLLALAGLTAAGSGFGPVAMAMVLMLSAPSITGAPNFVVMTGNDPVPSMRMLVVGTALFPLTALAALWSLPGIDGGLALGATGRMAVIVFCVVLGGLAVRARLGRSFDPETLERSTDGLSAVLLAVVAIGLMTQVGPMLRADPSRLLQALALVTAFGFALQTGILLVLGALRAPEAIAASVAAGNRNIALYFLALPDTAMEPLLLFIGCYQIPMYLTPVVMRGMHAVARRRAEENLS